MKSLLLRTIIGDIVTVIFCVGPIIASICLSALTLSKLNSIYWQILFFPFVLILNFILIIFVARIFLPKLKKGVFAVGPNLSFLAWLTHSMLTRSARTFGVHYLIHSVAFFRWLYWRALGAKVSYKISTSYKVTVHDVALIEIAEGVILAEDVEISGHIVRGDRVLVAPVRIGAHTFIGKGTYVGPRTRIGSNCWIGMGNQIVGEVLPDGTKIPSFAWAQGKPKLRGVDSPSES